MAARAAALALTVAVGGCADQPAGDAELSDVDRYWGVLAIAGGGLEHYEELERLVRTADLVVVARVSAVDEGPVYAPDGDSVAYADIIFEPIETIRGVRIDGGDADSPLVVQKLLPTGRNVDELREGVPSGRHLLVLRSGARFGRTPEEQAANGEYFLFQTPLGLFVEREDGGVSAPLAEPEESIARAASEMTFEDLLDSVRSLRDSPPIPVDLLQLGRPETAEDVARRVQARPG